MKRHTCVLNRLLSLVLVIALGGCSTISSSDVFNQDLQDKIRTGHVIKTGDHVIIHTQDNVKHEFTVQRVDEQRIEGRSVDGGEISVRIDDIASLQTKSFSAEKTAGLVGGVGFGLYAAYIFILTGTFLLLF